METRNTGMWGIHAAVQERVERERHWLERDRVNELTAEDRGA